MWLWWWVTRAGSWIRLLWIMFSLVLFNSVPWLRRVKNGDPMHLKSHCLATLFMSTQWASRHVTYMLYKSFQKKVWTWCLSSEGLTTLFDPQVKRTYSQGTYRAGAMRQVSLVGAVDEEVGDYFPEFISMLEKSPFLEVSVSIIMSVPVNTPTARGHLNRPICPFSLCMAMSRGRPICIF